MAPVNRQSEEMLELLEAHNAHDELIHHYENIQKKAFPPTTFHPLPVELRRATLRFMRFLADTIDLTPQAWFRAAVLLDAACLKKDGGLPIKDLPIAAAALVVLIKKEETADFNSYCFHLQEQIVQLRNYFRTLGYETEDEDITEDCIFRMELALMDLLRWQVNVPSIESWLSVFCTRLMLMCDPAVLPCLRWVWRFCTMHAEPFVLLGPAWPTLTPRSAAQGLLCVGVLAAGLVPLDSMSPSEAEAEAWETILHQFQPQQQQHMSGTHGPMSQKVLDQLENATCSDLADLQIDVATMLTMMLEVPSKAIPQQQR